MEMAVGKVTISSINKLNGYLWDTVVQGFGARRQTNGVFFYVRYRVNGSQVVRSLGRLGALTPDTARAKARQLLGTVAGGVDPFASSSNSETFGGVIDRYLDRKRAKLKPTSFAQTEVYLRRSAEPLHRLRLDQIDRRKIATLLGEIETQSGAVSRNRARSALSALFSWAITEGLLDHSPVTGTAKADEGNSRERAN
jgi:Arm DNA-binding domain/Phage integrase, N-terminal SAM-like domain